MSTDNGESWLEKEWLNHSSTYSNNQLTYSNNQVSLSGDGNFLYLIDPIYDPIYGIVGSKLFKLNTSNNNSNFISTHIPIMNDMYLGSFEVSYNGSFIVGYYFTGYYTTFTNNTIYISSSFGNQWSEKSICTCNISGGFSMSSTGRCDT